MIETKRKKEQKHEFKCSISVKAMTSGEHLKSCATNLLASIK